VSRGNDERRRGERKSFLILSIGGFQGCADFARVLTQIQHTVDNHFLTAELVVDSMEKSFGEQPVKTKNLAMNPRIKDQRINVGEK
jgi:hypothetical protein